MVSPLLFMAAGGAQSYANVKNAETDQQNKVRSALIMSDMENQFRERLAERQMQYGVERDRLKQQAVRETQDLKHKNNLDLEERKNDGRLKIEQAKGSMQRSNELLRQDRADARSNANISSRKELASLNNSKKSSGSSGQFSVRDLIRANDNDEKEIHKIKMQLNDPLIMQKDQMTKGAKTSDILKERLDELQMKVLDRQRIIDGNGAQSGDDAGFAELAKILKQ